MMVPQTQKKKKRKKKKKKKEKQKKNQEMEGGIVGKVKGVIIALAFVLVLLNVVVYLYGLLYSGSSSVSLPGREEFVAMQTQADPLATQAMSSSNGANSVYGTITRDQKREQQEQQQEQEQDKDEASRAAGGALSYSDRGHELYTRSVADLRETYGADGLKEMIEQAMPAYKSEYDVAFFQHIPKTGGTSLHRNFLRSKKDRRVCSSCHMYKQQVKFPCSNGFESVDFEADRNAVKPTSKLELTAVRQLGDATNKTVAVYPYKDCDVVMAHRPLQWLQHHLPGFSIYALTILREPLSMAISNFNFVALHHTFKSPTRSMIQSKYDNDIDRAFRTDYLLRPDLKPEERYLRKWMNAESATDAKYNLLHYFDCVLLLENYEETYSKLRSRLSFLPATVGHSMKLKAQTKTPAASSLENARKQLREEIEFYEFAKLVSAYKRC